MILTIKVKGVGNLESGRYGIDNKYYDVVEHRQLPNDIVMENVVGELKDFLFGLTILYDYRFKSISVDLCYDNKK